jgi:hypothetical protein
MIVVFMCDKDPINVTSGISDGIQTFFCFLSGYSGVEKQAYVFTAGKNAVTAASARQAAEFHFLIIPF